MTSAAAVSSGVYPGDGMEGGVHYLGVLPGVLDGYIPPAPSLLTPSDTSLLTPVRHQSVNTCPTPLVRAWYHCPTPVGTCPAPLSDTRTQHRCPTPVHSTTVRHLYCQFCTVLSVPGRVFPTVLDSSGCPGKSLSDSSGTVLGVPGGVS